MTKNLARSVSSHLKDHVSLEVERVDRLHLNAYRPAFSTTAAWFGSVGITEATPLRPPR